MGGGHHDHAPEPRVAPVKEDCAKNKIDLAYRDFCSHKLIPLNKCRYANFFLPWKCEHERHDYEKCQYEEFERRVKQMM